MSRASLSSRAWNTNLADYTPFESDGHAAALGASPNLTVPMGVLEPIYRCLVRLHLNAIILSEEVAMHIPFNG
jgi:hypothetical protein